MKLDNSIRTVKYIFSNGWPKPICLIGDKTITLSKEHHSRKALHHTSLKLQWNISHGSVARCPIKVESRSSLWIPNPGYNTPPKKKNNTQAIITAVLGTRVEDYSLPSLYVSWSKKRNPFRNRFWNCILAVLEDVLISVEGEEGHIFHPSEKYTQKNHFCCFLIYFDCKFELYE